MPGKGAESACSAKSKTVVYCKRIASYKSFLTLLTGLWLTAAAHRNTSPDSQGEGSDCQILSLSDCQNVRVLD